MSLVHVDTTLGSIINVALYLLIFGKFSKWYALLRVVRLLIFQEYFFEKRKKSNQKEIVYLRGQKRLQELLFLMVYPTQLKIVQVPLFQGLRIFFLPNIRLFG